ncbi:MAG: hypothetical protein V8S28_08430 [Lachnospiraceae bacterium]
MSQEKVERYKKEKANRKQTMKKDKAKSIAARTAGVIVCIALIGWIGYSGYSKWEATLQKQQQYLPMLFQAT